MKRNPSARDLIRETLKRACADAPSPAQILFRVHFSAHEIAKRANVSETTARNHLNNLSLYRGYSKCRINGTFGYRYDDDF